MDKLLDGKVVIVTGAATGIGEAIAKLFAKEGASVVVAGLPTDPVDDVARAINDAGGRAVAFAGDVADENDAEACVQIAVTEFGKLDVLINNAGVFLVTAETDKYPLMDFDVTLRNNVRSAFLMTRFALPYLQKTKGNVISTGSEAGELGLANNTPYGGTKAFLHAFMRGVAVEQAKHGVRANCVCPGPIDTAWTHKETGPMDKKMEQTIVQSVPLGRRGTPEEMANVFAFLASDRASYVTGALYFADGGTTIGKGAVGDEVPSALKQEPAGELALDHALEGNKNKPTHAVR